MKRLMISAVAVVGLLATAITVWPSHSPATGFSVGTAGMMSVQQLHAAAGVNKLPTEEYEDLSVVYSAAPKR
jgi:hypothetical protein